MPKSTQVLVLHWSLVCLLVTAAALSHGLRLRFPWFYDNVFFWGYMLLVATTILGWRKGCELTKLENHHRVLEGKPAYTDTFIKHYLAAWTGVEVSGLAITLALLGLMTVPILVYISGYFE